VIKSVNGELEEVVIVADVDVIPKQSKAVWEMERGKTGGERGEKFWSIRGAGRKSSPVSPVIFPQILKRFLLLITNNMMIGLGQIDVDEFKSGIIIHARHAF